MKKEPFNIKFKDLIISGKAKLTLDGYIVRIICWDRKGQYPIVALKAVGESADSLEVVIEIDNAGKVRIPNCTVIENGLYVEYDPIGISKKARVAYSLLKAHCIEKYMKKYGYVNVKENGFHWNAVNFANIYAKSHTNELHNDLKKNGNWEYDDDYDWE